MPVLSPTLEDQRAAEIDPAYLADYAQSQLDPDRLSPPEVEWSSILHLRELARKLCARRVKEDRQREDLGQGDLFDSGLQYRYPCNRDDRNLYVLLDELTISECQENIRSLTAEATAKNLHALKLHNYMESKIIAGLFKK